MRRCMMVMVCTLLILMAACSPISGLLPNPTELPYPSLTPRPTLTSTPTLTFTPQPTLTPTPVQVVLAGTPFVETGQGINPENAGRLALLARWGMGTPYAMRWSADSSRLALCSSRGVWVYWVETADLEWSWLSSSACRALAFDQAGERLAVGLEDGQVLILSMQGKVFNEWQAHTFVVFDLAWSPDGKWLASTSWDKSVRLWDTLGDLERPVFTFFAVHSGYERLAFNADGTRLLAAGGRDGLQAWRLKDGKSVSLLGLPLSAAGSPSTHVSLSADGANVLLGYPGQLRIQRTLNGATLGQVNQSREAYYGSAIEPSGERLALSLIGRVVLRKVSGGQVLASLLASNPLAVYPVMAFSPDGLRLAAAGSGLAIWRTDLEASPIELIPQGWLPGLVTSTALREDGWIASGLLDGSLWQMNPADGALSQLAPPYKLEMSAAGWNMTGNTALLAGLDRSLQMWAYPGNGWQALKLNRLKSLADCLAVSADGVTLAVASGNQVAVYTDLQQDNPETLKLPQRAVALRFLADGRLVTTLQDGLVWLWDGSTPSLKLTGVNPVVSADGTMLALAHFDWDASSVEVINLANGESRVEVPGDGRVMAFSTDNHLLATSGRKLQLWSLADGRLLSDLPVSGTAKSMYFSADGTQLVMVSGDGVISVWGVP